MRTPSARLCIPVVTLLLAGAACGGNDDGDAAATTTAAEAAVPTGSAGAPLDTVPTGSLDIPLETVPEGSSDIPLTPVDSADVPYAISITVGVDSGPDRVEMVPLGATVSISITNADADDEFHLHDYELGDGQVVPAGQTATFTFTADQPGAFELESHATDSVLLVLQVA